MSTVVHSAQAICSLWHLMFTYEQDAFIHSLQSVLFSSCLKCEASPQTAISQFCHLLCMLVQGLLVKMITGDQALIGRETAKQLGMGHNIFNTEVLLKVTARLLCRSALCMSCALGCTTTWSGFRGKASNRCCTMHVSGDFCKCCASVSSHR